MIGEGSGARGCSRTPGCIWASFSVELAAVAEADGDDGSGVVVFGGDNGYEDNLDSNSGTRRPALDTIRTSEVSFI